MSHELKNTYCVMGDQIESAVVLWPTQYCVMADRLMCYGRPVKSHEFNVYKARKEFFLASNHYITIYITTWSVDNLDEVGL